MRRVIFNQKGGVGKTTIVCNLAATAAVRGEPTLVVDLDAQCNASQYLLSSQELQASSGAADFFESSLRFGQHDNELTPFITRTPFDNLFVLAGHPDLEALQSKLESRHKIYKLRQALAQQHGFSQIFMDTPPALNIYSRSALIAAERVLVPFDCDDFARQALYALFDNINEIQADHNEELGIDGIVINQFQKRARLPARIVDELREEGMPLLATKLTHSVVVKESHDRSVPLPYLQPRHPVTAAFDALYRELQRT